MTTEVTAMNEWDGLQGEALRAKFGPAKQFADVAAVLRACDVRHIAHPADYMAWEYKSEEAAQAFVEANKHTNGRQVFGPVQMEDGTWVSAIETAGAQPLMVSHLWSFWVNPVLPDDIPKARRRIQLDAGKTLTVPWRNGSELTIDLHAFTIEESAA